ncbi:MAG: glycosyltransferase [Rhodospirillaceae bacterium]|nr:glycosyltransferase [Rhodospirillaceae bacterium]MCA8933718.1 glycosyltransferase [Rhodospirillaceae bacterium]
MKVSLVGYTDRYGAGRAAHRLLRALRRSGVDAHMLVLEKTTDDPNVVPALGRWAKPTGEAFRRADSLPARLQHRGLPHPWTTGWMPFPGMVRAIRRAKPDVVHLHWTAFALSPRQIAKLGVPVVWTLHDMAAFTGGCHYDGGCGRYAEGCGACPLLGSARPGDITHKTLMRKLRAWRDVPMTIVTPSHWLGDCARNSLVFRDKRVEVIINPLDLDVFKPRDRGWCRDLLGLPQDKKVILFGAVAATDDPRKGFDMLCEALPRVAAAPEGNDAMAVVFGAQEPADPPDLGLAVRYVGRITDDVALAALYAAADVTVVPSRQEVLGATAAESLACGTPVVGFNVGGIPDMLDHGTNGYLARPFEAADLAAGILAVLKGDAAQMRLAARRSAEARFDEADIVWRFLDVYA